MIDRYTTIVYYHIILYYSCVFMLSYISIYAVSCFPTHADICVASPLKAQSKK